MDEMKKLQEWFQKKDYETGLILLAKYSKNRNLLQNLHRKRYPAKLEHELKKFIKVHHDVESIGIKIIQPKIDPAPKIPPEEIKKTVSVENSKIEKPPDKSKLKILENDRKVIYDELPAELQRLWEQNRDAYKEIRSLHEKLKLMEKASPDTRQPLTVRIAELDDMIRRNWEAIDRWVPGQNTEVIKIKEVNHKRINANRKYISINIKKLSDPANDKVYRETLKKVQARVDELLAAGEEISEKKAEELRKLGVKL